MPGHGHKKSLENLSMERHGYNDSDPGISLSEINFRRDKSDLIELLRKFFYKEYRNALPDRNPKNRAFEKARSLIERDFDKGRILREFKYNEGLEKALKQAISHGYIWKIEIEKPWHPKFFFNFDKMKTFPFQHKEVVLWTGQPKHRFFSEPGKIDLLQKKGYEEFHNSNSVFNQNGIFLGTRHTDKSAKWASHNKAVYLAHSLATNSNYGAGHYARQKKGPIMEFRIPTDLIHLNYNAGDRSDRVTSNLEETKRFLEKPLNYSKGTIEFQYQRKKLLLDLCTGIWDWSRDQRENPNFQSVEEFHKQFFQKYPFRVPWNTNLTNQKLGKDEAEKLREKKLDAEGFYNFCGLIEDFLEHAEEFLDIIELRKDSKLTKAVRKNNISTVEYKDRVFPIAYQFNSASSSRYFIPNRAINKVERDCSYFNHIYEDPLEWENKVRQRWQKEGEKYYSDLFLIGNAIPSIIEELNSFENRFETYYKILREELFPKIADKELQEKIKRAKKDVLRTKKDLKSMDSIQTS